MLTKTIKLKRNEYTNIKTELHEHDIILLTGARGAGKSYPTAKYISELLENDETAQFMYMRIRESGLATYFGWCKDLNLDKLAGFPTSYKLDRGKPTRGDISLTGYDENGDIISFRVIGKCISLENSHDFKSGNYSDFKAIVFEEYAELNMNPDGEKKYVFNFLENMESIFRTRDKKIILLCNNLKTIPLLERAIEELTGEKFVNPIKIKIFREKNHTINNKFLDYLNGEYYDNDDFKVILHEFDLLFCNKEFKIYRHMVLRNRYYVTNNFDNQKPIYNDITLVRMRVFVNLTSMNQFSYKNTQIEKTFTETYPQILSEITRTLISQGSHILRDLQ